MSWVGITHEFTLWEIFPDKITFKLNGLEFSAMRTLTLGQFSRWRLQRFFPDRAKADKQKSHTLYFLDNSQVSVDRSSSFRFSLILEFTQHLGYTIRARRKPLRNSSVSVAMIRSLYEVVTDCGSYTL